MNVLLHVAVVIFRNLRKQRKNLTVKFFTVQKPKVFFGFFITWFNKLLVFFILALVPHGMDLER